MYADITFKDRNRLKRWLQQRRLRDALATVAPTGSPEVVLDFGAGNGELCKHILERFPRARVICYEPSAALLGEAKQNLQSLHNVQFAQSLAEISEVQVDVAFSLEVFEHLPQAQISDALHFIRERLTADGIFVIGVPVEIGAPALYKGLFRMVRRYGDYDATWRNVVSAAFGRPPATRPMSEIAPGLPYHFHHLGFDYRGFETMLARMFPTYTRRFTPFGSLGALSPEVYFRAVKR